MKPKEDVFPLYLDKFKDIVNKGYLVTPRCKRVPDKLRGLVDQIKSMENRLRSLENDLGERAEEEGEVWKLRDDLFQLRQLKNELVELKPSVEPSIPESEDFIRSLFDYFGVEKPGDIRMVYNGTSCGLNKAVWAPNFGCPLLRQQQEPWGTIIVLWIKI